MKWRWRLGMLVVTVFSWGIGQGAMADTQQDTADYEHALKSAPPGIGLHQIFEVGQESQNNQVVATQTPGTDAVVITKGRNQFGKIWSTQGNVFDLNRNATASMWLYFGDNAAKPADGMALVLQNDPRGTEAQSLRPVTSEKEVLAGESLNVWGVDKNPEHSQTDIAKSAIQRSWALEFDTNLNKSDTPGGADAFDKAPALNGPHVASGYPGQATTYHQYSKKAFFSSDRYYYGLNHQGILQPLTLADGTWHHLTLKWRVQPTASEEGPRDSTYPQMTYIFDDKDPKTDEATPAQAKQETVSIDPKIIDPNNTGKCLWGFTGAAGNQGANNLVIFENVPGLVDVEAQTHLQDLTTQQPLTAGQPLKDRQIRRDDRVQLTYQATYGGGKQDWRDVRAHLNLPDGLTFTTGEIRYAADKDRPQTLTAADLVQPGLDLALTQTLNAQNRWVKVTLTGYATAQQDTPLSVPSAKGTFTAVNGLATTGTPAFSLVPKFDLGLKRLTAANVETTVGQGVTLNAQVSGLSREVLARQELTLHPEINGHKQAPVALTQMTSTGQLTYPLEADKLQPGRNNVEFTVTDPYGNQSNSVVVTVMVKGTLSFEVLKMGTFQTTQLSSQSVTKVFPVGDWTIQVLDTREIKTRWQLQLAATPFKTTTGRLLAGGLVYQRPAQAAVPVTQTPQTVYQGIPQQDQEVTDVTASWKDGMGLGLTLKNTAFSGQYQAQLTWSLNNVPAV